MVERDQPLGPRVGERLLVITFLIPVLVSLVFRFLLVFNRWFNPDEYEHLHHAWMVMMGHLPYRDFFDNHTPGLWYLLAPLAWLLDERSTYLFASRFVMGVVTFAIFLVVYKLAATNRGYAGPLFSILLLSVEPLFLYRTLEVRPDQVVILSWLLGAWLLVRPPGAMSHRAYVGSGLCVGMGLLFSPKGLFAIASLGGALVLLRQAGRGRPPSWRDIALFAGMSMIPLASLLLLMWSRDDGWPYLLVQQTFFYNFAYPERFSGVKHFYPSLVHAPVFWVPAALGSLLAVQRFRQAQSEREKRRFVVLAASTVGAALAHFMFIPVPYSQSLLPVITFLAILGGECGAWIKKYLGNTDGYARRMGLSVCVVVILALGSLHSLTSIVTTQRPFTKTIRSMSSG